MWSNVFQHRSVSFVKLNFTKPHKKEKRTPTQIVQVSSLDCGLVNEPRIAVIAMQGGVNSLCHFGCIERAVKEAINVAALVCSRKEIVELPHINVRAVRAKVFIADVGFCHCIDLCVCYQQPWNVALYLLR